MKEDDFKLLIESIKQAGEIRAGRLKPSREFTIKTQDVKNVRKTLHVTQIQFSNMIGVTVDTIQMFTFYERPKSAVLFDR